MRTVKRYLYHFLTAILALSIIGTGSLLYISASEHGAGHVYYNQSFEKKMNLETIADAGIVKVPTAAFTDYDPVINENGYLYADARDPTGGNKRGYNVMQLPDVLPSDAADYTVEATFRFSGKPGGAGEMWNLSGFGIGFGEGTAAKKDCLLRYDNGGKFDKFGASVLSSVADKWLVPETGPGKWIDLKVSVIAGKIAKASVTVQGEAEITFNADASNYTVGPGGKVFLIHCGSDFEIKQLKLVKGSEYTSYTGENAEKSYSQTVTNIIPDNGEPQSIMPLAFQTSSPAGGTINVRIIFGLWSLEHDQYGFEAVLNSAEDKKISKTGKTVWMSVNGYVDGSLKVCTAEELGAEYLTVLALTDIGLTGTFIYEIDCYTLNGDVKDYGEKIIITVQDGEVSTEVHK